MLWLYRSPIVFYKVKWFLPAVAGFEEGGGGWSAPCSREICTNITRQSFSPLTTVKIRWRHGLVYTWAPWIQYTGKILWGCCPLFCDTAPLKRVQNIWTSNRNTRVWNISVFQKKLPELSHLQYFHWSSMLLRCGRRKKGLIEVNAKCR
jgi:hypothetical protein